MTEIFNKLINRGVDPVAAWKIVTALFPDESHDHESRMLHALAVELVMDQPEFLTELH